jgi:hypothetical protein
MVYPRVSAGECRRNSLNHPNVTTIDAPIIGTVFTMIVAFISLLVGDSGYLCITMKSTKNAQRHRQLSCHGRAMNHKHQI